MHPQKQQIEQAIASLRSTHAEISTLLSDASIMGLKVRVLTNLETSINYLSLQIGADGISAGKIAGSGPLKKLFGRVLQPDAAGTGNVAQEPVQLKSPEQIVADEIIDKLDTLYPEFPNIETDAILDTYSELEIRAVAKRAGMAVTENSPKKVDAKFVNQIKEAIKKKAELDAAGTGN